METNDFPGAYRLKLSAECGEKIQKAKDESNKKVNKYKDKIPKGNPFQLNYYVMFVLIGTMGFAVFYYCSCIVPTGIDLMHFIVYPLLTGIAVTILGMILVLIINTLIYRAYYSPVAEANKFEEEEKKSLEIQIKAIIEDSKRRQEGYTEAFEENAQKMSARLAGSEISKEVIEWMTNGFCKSINAAKRSSYVEKITVPFTFNIYSDKITCNLGTYDFEKKRCSNLDTHLMQAALARAIASAIQLNIVKKYPQDVTGTSVTIDISHNYSQENDYSYDHDGYIYYVKTTITYIAPNGNYQAVRSW